MAKDIGGKFAGSIGNFNFYTVRGQQLIRSKPHPKASKRTVRKKRTDPQKNQLSRFTIATRLAHSMKGLFNQSFETVGNQIGKCQAMRYMLASAISGESPDFKIDFSKLLVARGSALMASSVNVTSTSQGSLLFTWEDNSRFNRNASNDEAILVAYTEEHDHCFFTMKGGSRKSCSGELDVKFFAGGGAAFHTWVSFVKKDGSTADSVYAGSVIVAK